MEDAKLKMLMNKIREIKTVKRSDTAILDTPHLKKCIEMKLKEGRFVKQIYEALIESGYKLSLPTFRKWVKQNCNLQE